MIWKRKVSASAREVVVELGNCLIDELKVVRGWYWELRSQEVREFFVSQIKVGDKSGLWSTDYGRGNLLEYSERQRRDS